MIGAEILKHYLEGRPENGAFGKAQFFT